MKQRKENGFGSFGIIIIVIIVGCLSLFGYFLYNSRSEDELSTRQQGDQAGQDVAPKNILRVGETIDEDGLTADTKEFQPFIDYVVSNLQGTGITKGEFIGAHSVSELAEEVREGRIDVVIDSAFPVYVVDELAGAQVIADRWKGGVGAYHSAIFVKEESSIKTLNDLKGKMLAFDSQTSTVGYFLPKAELIQQGYTLTQKDKPTDPCKPTEICYVFVHGNVYDSVAKGVVPAGAESELEIDAYFGKNISNYRIISRSEDILRFLVATRNDLNPQLVDKLKTILFTMDKSPEGRTVLDKFAQTKQFTPVENSDAAYGIIKNLTNSIEDEIVRQ